MGTAKPREGQCTYAYREGKRCTSEIEGRGQFCFWHDPAANKESPDIKDRLQEWARSHRYLEGIKLGGSKGVDLSNADLFHANLKKGATDQCQSQRCQFGQDRPIACAV